MRLFMTTDSVGGVWSYALTLAAALQPHGVATTLAVIGPVPSADQRAAAQAIPSLNLRPIGGTLDWLAEDADALRPLARTLAEIARAGDADVVQLNSPALAAWNDFDGPVIGICHSCVASWWVAMRRGPMPPDFEWRTALLARGYAACDALAAPSAAFAATTAALYGVTPHVVHNGAPWPVAAPLPKQRTVLTAGRLWDEAKGFATLDAAAAGLSAPLLAAGPLRHPNGAELSAGSAVTLGTLSASALRHRLQQTAIFASAALYEPFGLAVLEAAQSGCALVLSDLSTFRELWQDACVLVPPGDPAAWATALQALLDDPAATAQLGARAAARAARYSETSTASAMLQLYRGLQTRHGLAA